jgi:hypothetical protein
LLDAIIINEAVMWGRTEVVEETGRRGTFNFALGEVEGGAVVAANFFAERC